ncbi:hypothetical protein OH76DRAFT_1102812 [Lentinus brumalis]|uniref:Uncharacterized protein n=1 Tax=Lentinus brumalis TaxID=2498619 RepID=A0A371CVN1_9APHY|nr:hypothetical protein OH76DRAFT_1102812 [Polyporus brumalis]
MRSAMQDQERVRETRLTTSRLSRDSNPSGCCPSRSTRASPPSCRTHRPRPHQHTSQTADHLESPPTEPVSSVDNGPARVALRALNVQPHCSTERGRSRTASRTQLTTTMTTKAAVTAVTEPTAGMASVAGEGSDDPHGEWRTLLGVGEDRDERGSESWCHAPSWSSSAKEGRYLRRGGDAFKDRETRARAPLEERQGPSLLPKPSVRTRRALARCPPTRRRAASRVYGRRVKRSPANIHIWLPSWDGRTTACTTFPACGLHGDHGGGGVALSNAVLRVPCAGRS